VNTSTSGHGITTKTILGWMDPGSLTMH